MGKEPDNKYARWEGAKGIAGGKGPKCHYLNAEPRAAGAPSFSVGRKGPNMFGGDGDGSDRATEDSFIDKKGRQISGTDSAQQPSYDNVAGKKNLLGARPSNKADKGKGYLPYLEED